VLVVRYILTCFGANILVSSTVGTPTAHRLFPASAFARMAVSCRPSGPHTRISHGVLDVCTSMLFIHIVLWSVLVCARQLPFTTCQWYDSHLLAYRAMLVVGRHAAVGVVGPTSARAVACLPAAMATVLPWEHCHQQSLTCVRPVMVSCCFLS
jgi:hypothetical protein